jgi:argininosuccinate lyase
MQMRSTTLALSRSGLQGDGAAPLFDGAKTHHVEGLRRIDRAHLVMLVETGILDADQRPAIARALEAIEREIDPAALAYTGEVEDFFF